jgi:3-deoxy-D-manno-octulosonic-acid transferase
MNKNERAAPMQSVDSKVIVADKDMLKKCVDLLKSNNDKKNEVIDILEKEVSDITEAEKKLIN